MQWFSHHIETHASSFALPFDTEQRKKIWALLARSEQLDRFLGKKFPNLKRYGCEGAESMLPALGALFELSAKCEWKGLILPARLMLKRAFLGPIIDGITADVSSVVVSLPHRGRLSMLCDPDILDYSPAALFSKIKGRPEFDPETAPGATGDVISHLSAIKTQEYGGKGVKIEVLQNPSHLEVRPRGRKLAHRR